MTPTEGEARGARRERGSMSAIASAGAALLAVALVGLYLLLVPAWLAAELIARHRETPAQRARREWRYGAE